MLKPSSSATTPAKDGHTTATATAPTPTADTKTTEDKPARYASPPCYLSEFFYGDSADHTAQ